MLKKICPVVFSVLLVACGDSGSSSSANDAETSSSSLAENVSSSSKENLSSSSKENLSSSSKENLSSSSTLPTTANCAFEGEVGDSEWIIKQKQPSENFCKTVLGVSSNTEDMEFRCEGEWLVTVYKGSALGADDASRKVLYEQLKSSCK